jgi:hypothetical protein
MLDPIAKTGAWAKQMREGHLNYFAVSGNHPSLWWFFNEKTTPARPWRRVRSTTERSRV